MGAYYVESSVLRIHYGTRVGHSLLSAVIIVYFPPSLFLSQCSTIATRKGGNFTQLWSLFYNSPLRRVYNESTYGATSHKEKTEIILGFTAQGGLKHVCHNAQNCVSF